METKHNGIFLGMEHQCLVTSLFMHLNQKQDFSHFCCIPCIINSCMEEVCSEPQNIFAHSRPLTITLLPILFTEVIVYWTFYYLYDYCVPCLQVASVIMVHNKLWINFRKSELRRLVFTGHHWRLKYAQRIRAPYHVWCGTTTVWCICHCWNFKIIHTHRSPFALQYLCLHHLNNRCILFLITH